MIREKQFLEGRGMENEQIRRKDDLERRPLSSLSPIFIARGNCSDWHQYVNDLVNRPCATCPYYATAGNGRVDKIEDAFLGLSEKISSKASGIAVCSAGSYITL